MARQSSPGIAALEYLPIGAAIKLLRSLPLARAARLGYALGGLAYQLDRPNRRIARRNLEIAFPQLGAAARLAILRGMYRHFGLMAAEWTHAYELTPHNISQYVEYDGRENWDRAEQLCGGRGIFVMTGHFGNFELLHVAHSLYGTPIAIIHRPLRNSRLDAEVMAVREYFGNTPVARNHAGRRILGLNRRKMMVAVPIDLDVRDGVFVDFFGLKAGTTDGLARIAMVTGAPVLPAFMIRDGYSLRHRIKILPPIEVVGGADKQAAVIENTRRFTAVFEAMVREYPEHWNWIHRRWKTRPPGESRFY